MRALFATLGQSRDREVLASGVATLLAEIGAPPLKAPPGPAGPNPAEAVRGSETQGLFLAWITWRTALAEPAATPPDTTAPEQADHDAATFHRQAARRLRRWHRRIAADCAAFDQLDDAALHALRKRIKRQRYAVEFFAPVLRRRAVERYLKPLAIVQDRMGELSDLFVARASYQSLVTTDPTAWFAVGWLAARIADVRALAKSELRQLAKADPPQT